MAYRPSKTTRAISVRLPNPVAAWLDRLARQQHVTISEAAAALLERAYAEPTTTDRKAA